MKDFEGWRQFTELCSQLTSAEEFDRFFELFLTIDEKHLLASRYLIIKALLDGKLTQREIAQTHHVSIAQITRGSNALKRIDSQIEEFFREHALAI